MDAITFQYEIFVNGTFADSKPTLTGALALIAIRFYGNPNVEIRRRGVVVWKPKKD